MTELEQLRHVAQAARRYLNGDGSRALLAKALASVVAPNEWPYVEAGSGLGAKLVREDAGTQRFITARGDEVTVPSATAHLRFFKRG